MIIDGVDINDTYLDEIAKEFSSDALEKAFEQLHTLLSSDCNINSLIEEIRNLWRTMQSFANDQLGDMMFETAKFVRKHDETHTFISKKHPCNTIFIKNHFIKPIRQYRHQHR